MVRKFKMLAIAGAVALIASPAFAAKVMTTPVGAFDLDPFNILAPAEPAPAPAPAEAPMKKKHHMKHHAKKMM